MKKEERIKKVFGGEGSRFYNLKRNSFFTTVVILFLVAFFIRRYFNILTNLKYLELVNIVSLGGLLIAIGTFHLANYMFELNLRKRDYFFIYLMCITGITFSFLYFRFENYDKIEHFFFPMIFASIVFYVISEKLKIKLSWRLLITFFIIVGSLSIFEVGEYFLDLLFNWRLQGVFRLTDSGYTEILARIDDTMIDIALGILGTLLYSLTTYFIEKRKTK